MKYLAILLPLALGACASTPKPEVIDSSCSWVNPIFISKQDKLTQKTASAILSHDDKWEQICGGKK